MSVNWGGLDEGNGFKQVVGREDGAAEAIEEVGEGLGEATSLVNEVATLRIRSIDVRVGSMRKLSTVLISSLELWGCKAF